MLKSPCVNYIFCVTACLVCVNISIDKLSLHCITASLLTFVIIALFISIIPKCQKALFGE